VVAIRCTAMRGGSRAMCILRNTLNDMRAMTREKNQ
jgi:hypothetical protein